MFYAKAATLALHAKRFGYETRHNPFVKAIINPIPDMDCQFERGYDNPVNQIFPVGQMVDRK